MAQSIKQKKSRKKKKGEHTQSRIRTKEYQRSRTPHCLPGNKGVGVARMLVRNHVNELLRIECNDWRRGAGSTEIFTATAFFRDGQQITQTAERRYAAGEREAIFGAEFSSDEGERGRAVSRAEAIRRFRWSEKQRVLGELQSKYAKGLPREAATV